MGDLVRIESPSDDPKALGRMAERLTELFRDFGTVERHELGPGGAPHLDVHIAGRRDENGRYTLVVCHYDTVWELGTLARMPFASMTTASRAARACLI